MSKAMVCSAVATIVLAGTVVAWAQVSLEPGEYQLAAEVQIPGSQQSRKATSVDCLTPGEAQDFQSLMLRELASEDTCKVSNLQTGADRITFDTACDFGALRSTATTDITFGSDWYKAIVRTELNGAVSTSTIDAKRIGAVCTEDAAK
jgi:hypothetical protein